MVYQHYKVDPPAIISFSGGRSSGFMLHNILEAHNWELPEGVFVIFGNTGLEHHETYEFIHKIEEKWCPVIWLEYEKWEDSKPVHGYKVVNYETASRNGEPFEKLIKENQTESGKPYMPNPRTRICTQYLKINPKYRFCKERNITEWDNVVGLRYDEPRRVNNARGWYACETISAPMYHAEHDHNDVLEFWKNYEFDLEIPSKAFTNCVGCFLKNYKTLKEVARLDPKQLEWWDKMEKWSDRQFDYQVPSYERILKENEMQLEFDFEKGIDCFCHD